MLFMVIERFRNGEYRPVGERFRRSGRMMPAGLTYHASWMESTGARCFQIMEAADPALLDAWISHWSDLVDFEVIPILTSGDFWARAGSGE
jgi:hypothetical protein